MCRKDLARILSWARATVLPVFALDSSSTEGLSQAKDITQSSLTSIADPLADGHDCIPSGSCGLFDLLRMCDYLSQVSLFASVGSAWCSCSALIQEHLFPVTVGIPLWGHCASLSLISTVPTVARSRDTSNGRDEGTWVIFYSQRDLDSFAG